MPGPMSRPDGVKETSEQRKERGRKIMCGASIRTGKTNKVKG